MVLICCGGPANKTIPPRRPALVRSTAEKAQPPISRKRRGGTSAPPATVIARAQYSLGVMLMKGCGVTQDAARGRQLIEAAVERGLGRPHDLSWPLPAQSAASRARAGREAPHGWDLSLDQIERY